MASRPFIAFAFAFILLTLVGQARATDGAGAAAMVQQASLAVETVTREETFTHRMFQPEKAGSRVIILMHGSGGDETTLVSLAQKIDPDATLIGIRGRVVQNGVKRWYKRVTPTEFDQQDVRAEAAAFADFVTGMARERRIDLSNATFLGYSNGANLIAALTQLHPGLVRRAVLLRAMPVLADAPKADLSGARILTITGENDRLYFPFASKLEAMLRDYGASVDARIVASGHGFGDEDARIAAEWLGSIAKQANISATGSGLPVLFSLPVSKRTEGEKP